MTTDDPRDEPTIGLTVKKRGHSFQFDQLIDSLGEDRSSQLATSLQTTSPDTAYNPVVTNAAPPAVSIVKSKSSSTINAKRGFLKRLFSSPNVPSNWASQTGNQINEEDNNSIASSMSSVRNRTSSIFRRPDTRGSILSTLSSTTNSTNSRMSPNVAQSGRSSFVSSFKDAGAGASPLLPAIQPIDSRIGQIVVQTGSSLQQSDRPTHTALPTSVSQNSMQRTSSGDFLMVKDVNRGSFKQEHSTADAHQPGVAVLETAIPCVTSTSTKRQSLSDASMSESAIEKDMHTEALVMATALYEWQDPTMHPSEYAAYLGTDKDLNHAVCRAYLDLFDFHNKSIIRSLRQLCAKLYIRGETQVIDRVLEAFSRRWRTCNQQDPYLTQEMAHIIAFALITLNTDLHIANVESDYKMRKSAFTTNTMAAINAGIDADTQAVEDATNESTRNENSDEPSFFGDQTIRYVPRTVSTSGAPDAILPLVRNTTNDANASNASSTQAPQQAKAPLKRKLTLRKSPSFMTDDRAIAVKIARDAYLKDALQDMYQSVKNEQIRQPELATLGFHDSTEQYGSNRRRPLDLRSLHGGNRSRSLKPGDMLGKTSSVISLPLPNELSMDTRRSVSNGDIFNRPKTGRGETSQLTNQSGLAPQRGLGFASSLSNVIIREENTSIINSPLEVADAIEAAEEDDLMLYGAPFAKEGRVMHKLYDDSSNSKKARAKNWTSDTFAVVSKGELRLFDFSIKAMKNNQKLFGGGDWTQNARSLINLSLIQTVAAALPEGTYSKDRLFIWALTMPDGVMHLFHVGTEELVQEWISTVNYWAARTTKEPLLGAVDNAEYGWGSCLENALQLTENKESTPASADSSLVSRRNSTSTFSMMISSEHVSSDEYYRRYPGNRATIRNWQPDPKPLLMSVQPQDAQLIALHKFVSRLQSQLADQNAKRALLTIAFSPQHPNLYKASHNFDMRRQHWQSEIVKYKTYIEALEHGIRTAEEVRLTKLNKNLKDLQGDLAPPLAHIQT